MTKIVGVDVGGTFTDVFLFEPEGETRASKAASTRDGIGGVLEALEGTVQLASVDALAFGSTIATNALVQRRLARVGLLTTAGFRDILDTRRLWRPQLFGHSWVRPLAVVPRRLRLECRERIDWQGRVMVPLQDEDVTAAAQRFKVLRVEAVAVAFLFSYLNPQHERRAAGLLQQVLTGIPIMLSHEVNPERHEYERTSTTAIAAGLAPIVRDALSLTEQRLRSAGLRRTMRVMKSNGGVMSPRAAWDRPVELVKSGPAGGASAGAFLADHLAEPNLILLDMGGTTADASLIIDGRPARTDVEMTEWDIPIRVPVVDIRSIGAGGGSIARLDAAGGLHVGPQSAGADPGPAAYGKWGGHPTVTDAAVVAGWLDPAYFLGGRIPLDAGAAAVALEPVAEGLGFEVSRAAAAVLHMTSTEMAALIRQITIDRGLDPRDFALVAFGGAGPMFIGALLEEVGLSRGFVPAGASTLSAMGGAFADVSFDYVRSLVGLVGDLAPARVRDSWQALLVQAGKDLEAEALRDAEYTTSVDLRYAGQWHELEIATDPDEELGEAAKRFENEHERLWGHRRSEDPIEVVALRLSVLARVPKAPLGRLGPKSEPTPKSSRPATFFPETHASVPVFERGALGAGWGREGPLIIEEPQTTSVVPPGFSVEVGSFGELVVGR